MTMNLLVCDLKQKLMNCLNRTLYIRLDGLSGSIFSLIISSSEPTET